MRTLLSLMLLKLLSADAAAGANVAAPATEAPAEPEAPKVEKPKAEKQNGVARPGADTACGRIWGLADKISAANNRPAKRAEVIKAADELGINPATASTQFGRWHRFWGIPAEPRVAKTGSERAEGEAADAAKPARAKGKGKAKGATVGEGAAALGEVAVEA